MSKIYSEYKNSSIEWLGEVPKHWETGPLKHVVEINPDKLRSKDADDDYEIRYVDIGNVNSKGEVEGEEEMPFRDAPSRARNVVQDGDTIVSTVRTYLKAIAYMDDPPENRIVSTGFAVLRPSEKLYPPFLGRLASTPEFVDAVVANSTGVSYPAINSSRLGDLPVWIPPLEEQRTIAAYLDGKTTQIDTLIAKKQRLIDLLQEQRTAVINRAVTQGLDPDAPMQDSGIEWLGEVPKKWRVVRLKYLINGSLAYGANESANEENPEHPRYIRITDFDDNGTLREETFKSLSPDIANDYLLDDGDILFARSGATVGKTFQFKDYEGDACYAGYLIKASPNEEKILSDFLYLFTKSKAYENWKNSIFIQATIQNIGANKYQELEIPVPPVEEQRQIVNHLSNELSGIDEVISREQLLIERLELLRKSLISEVVTGKIDVRDDVPESVEVAA